MIRKTTKKVIIGFFVASLLMPLSSVGQITYTTIASGDWDDDNTWDQANHPTFSLGRGDIINIQPGHEVVLDGTLSTDLRTPGNTININDSLTITGTLDGSQNLTLNVNPSGRLVIDDWSSSKDNRITVNITGKMTVNNDMTLGGDADITIDGTLNISGDLTAGNNSSLSGSGTVTVGGACFEGNTNFCSQGPLPVELLYFNADQGSGGVRIEWSTASELNNDYFTLERSKDGIRFDLISTIQGNGTVNSTNNYQYTDTNPPLGLVYYRLSQTDYDGTSEQFPLISVLFNPDDKGLSVYPNPVSGSIMTLQTAGKLQNEIITLRILDLQGKLMNEQTIVADRFGNVDLQINLKELQKKNTYIFNLVSASESEVVKVITEY